MVSIATTSTLACGLQSVVIVHPAFFGVSAQILSENMAGRSCAAAIFSAARERVCLTVASCVRQQENLGIWQFFGKPFPV